MTTKPYPSRYHLALLAVTLLALGLRLYNLAYHSLWFDEAMSVHWARQSVPRILEVGFTLQEDRLPPLYYLLLKGWTALFGLEEAGVRSLSVLFGVLLIPPVADIGSRLYNRRVGLAAALLVALNPFLIWYAQEARMYAPAVFFGTLSVWACLRWLRTNAWGYFGLFVLAATAGLYSHLYTAFLLPGLGVWLLLTHRRRWWLFGLGGLLIGAAFAPLALAIWRFSGEAPPGDPLSGIGGRAWWLLQAFTTWKAPLPLLLQAGIPALVALFAAAAYLKPRGRLPRPTLLVTLLLVGPFVIAHLLLLRNHLAFFGERYFIVMVPWLMLLAAGGANNLSRRCWGYPLPLALLFVLVVLPLPGQWSLPASKEAWRQSAAYLARQATPDHGILIHPDWVRYPFQYYYRGPGQTYAVFSNVTPETALDGPLQGVVGEHPVIWLVQSHLAGPDPDRLVEGWFAARYPLVTELYPPGISLKGYAPGYQPEQLPPQAQPVEIQFANGMHLVGYRADRSAIANEELFHPPPAGCT